MKDWIITENDKLKAKELAKQSGIPPFLAMLLSSRGIDTVEKQEFFFLMMQNFLTLCLLRIWILRVKE